jgi:hypothetical protein
MCHVFIFSVKHQHAMLLRVKIEGRTKVNALFFYERMAKLGNTARVLSMRIDPFFFFTSNK